MAKKRKREGLSPGANFAQEDVLRAFSNAMIQDAGLLDIWIRHITMYVEGDQVCAFTEPERMHLKKAAQELRQAQKRLLVIGRRGQRRASR